MSTDVQTVRDDELKRDAGSRTAQPGFRLAKVELFNWGTFDNTVHGIHPRGESVLLVGKNGTGKSTLVDSLLTLLVRPNTRNYNVAAGASKTERDEKTYIQGAYDKTVGSDGLPKVQYLRPGNKHYSALLASFENAQSKQRFTVAQVLHLDSNNKIKKIYAFDGQRERGIVQDLGHLGDGTSILTTLRDRGFQATDSYTQYFEWLRRLTSFRPKAMDMFNQAAWVKDVQRLDSFVRTHMLEKKPWNEKVSQLLKHFNELSEAHRALVIVRHQAEMLAPVIKHGDRFETVAGELQDARARLEATALYFKSATKKLLEPLCEEWQQRVSILEGDLRRTDEQIDQAYLEIARFKVEIENSGGDRLRQLPDLIRQQEELADIKSRQRIEFQSLLSRAGIDVEVTSAQDLQSTLANVAARSTELKSEQVDAHQELKQLQYELGRLQSELSEDRLELEALKQRKGNMPQGLAELRDQLCGDLKLTAKELPFAAELMTVDPSHRVWEASIEQVLHGFARDLLVPDKLYAKVSGYIDRNRWLTRRAGGSVFLTLALVSKPPVMSGQHPSGLCLTCCSFARGIF